MKTLFKSILIASCMALSTAAIAQNVTPGDRAFVAKVSQGGMFEVAAGQLAVDRASTQDIRDFAVAEVHDHMLVGDKLKRLSAQFRIGFTPRLNPVFSAKLRHLASLSGPGFDREYLAEMDQLHGIDGAAFADESVHGGPLAFRLFGAETRRIVLRHTAAIRAVPAN